MLQNVRRVGAFAHALQKTAAHPGTAMVLDQAGQQSGEALVEAGQGIGGMVFQIANVHPGFDDGSVGPDVGAAQVRHPENV
jgi:hypothetical protein